MVQRFYNRPNELTETQANDRLKLLRQFIGWPPRDKAPDANTVWDFREALTQADVFERIFDRFRQRLRERGLSALPRKLVSSQNCPPP